MSLVGCFVGLAVLDFPMATLFPISLGSPMANCLSLLSLGTVTCQSSSKLVEADSLGAAC